MALLTPPDRRPIPFKALCGDLDDALVEIAREARDAYEFAFRMSAADAADYAARIAERYRSADRRDPT